MVKLLMILWLYSKESKVRFDEDDDFKARAYKYVVGLQNGEPGVVQAWELICDVSRKGKSYDG